MSRTACLADVLTRCSRRVKDARCPDDCFRSRPAEGARAHRRPFDRPRSDPRARGGFAERRDSAPTLRKQTAALACLDLAPAIGDKPVSARAGSTPDFSLRSCAGGPSCIGRAGLVCGVAETSVYETAWLMVAGRPR